MSLTPSTMLELGTKAPDFTLPDPDGNKVSLTDVSGGKALLVMFICNHCPFVKHVQHELVNVVNDYSDKGLKAVAISSNNIETHPEDRPELMKKVAEENDYPFPYLYDETQEVAKAYKAACTPDFFLFDESLELVYRGQLDDSRPENGKPVTGKDLRKALDQLLEDGEVTMEQRPSAGCNIKWKPGKEPAYFG